MGASTPSSSISVTGSEALSVPNGRGRSASAERVSDPRVGLIACSWSSSRRFGIRVPRRNNVPQLPMSIDRPLAAAVWARASWLLRQASSSWANAWSRAIASRRSCSRVGAPGPVWPVAPYRGEDQQQKGRDGSDRHSSQCSAADRLWEVSLLMLLLTCDDPDDAADFAFVTFVTTGLSSTSDRQRAAQRKGAPSQRRGPITSRK